MQEIRLLDRCRVAENYRKSRDSKRRCHLLLEILDSRFRILPQYPESGGPDGRRLDLI
jgi:hypothetical protein